MAKLPLELGIPVAPYLTAGAEVTLDVWGVRGHERYRLGYADWRLGGGGGGSASPNTAGATCTRHCGSPACGDGCEALYQGVTIDGQYTEIHGLLEGPDGSEKDQGP